MMAAAARSVDLAAWPDRSPQQRWREIAAACAVAAVVYTGFFCARDAANGFRVDVVESATRAGAEWLAWAALAPIAWWAAGCWRLDRLALSPMLFRHAALAIALAVGQAALFWLLLQLRAELDVAPVRLLVFVRGDDPRFLATRFDSNLVIYAFTVAIATATRRAGETARANRDRSEAERQLLAARLDALRQQLRPHFVLNALNTFLSALPGRPAEARRILNALIGLLSRPEASAPLVTLATELELVRLYATIEEARFRDSLAVEWAIDPAVTATLVPPFALQTLFENAIRHATPRIDGGLGIRVSAQRNDERIEVRVANDGAIGAGTAGGTGIGLVNLSARLALLFDGQAKVALFETGGRIVACMTLPDFAERAA